jgi:hypothetical protein
MAEYSENYYSEDDEELEISELEELDEEVKSRSKEIQKLESAGVTVLGADDLEEAPTTVKRLIADEDYGEWLQTFKFLATHIDGPVATDMNVGNINLFKVYKNIDEDMV